MKYIVIPRKNPQALEEVAKFYMQAKMLGTIKLADICQEISLSSSLTRGDVSNTIMSFLDTIPKYLKMGYSVKMDELGTFRLSLSSSGSDNEDEVGIGNLKGIHIIFTPSVKMKDEIEKSPVEEFPKVK